MKIGMLLKGSFPPDIRVQKEARALISAGHDVWLLCQGRGRESPGVVDSIDVRRVPLLSGTARVRNELGFYLRFVDRHWEQRLRAFVGMVAPEVLHVHDLPLARTALRVARPRDIPVVLDLHENYPAALPLWSRHRSQLVRWLESPAFRWRAYERWASQESDRVIVVVEEARDRLMREHGVPEGKITVVRNTEDPATFLADPPSPASADSATFDLLYVGGGGRHRGLETAVHALGYLRDARPPVRLRIVGPRDEEGAALQALASEIEVVEQLEILGWQPFERVRSLIETAHVCLVPHERNPHTDATIPHKLFQYMLAGKPVVVSDCAPLRRVVEETGAGVVFRSGDAQHLADRVNHLLGDAALRVACGSRAADASRGPYSWDRDAETIIGLFGELSDEVGLRHD
jgi:glycosyltransferase involved in cell wall biosynthesis